MDSLLDNNVSGTGLDIGGTSRSYLLETAKWSKFLAILGFVMIGLFVVLAIGIGFFMGSQFDAIMGGASVMGSIGIAAMYLLIALLYFFPILYLYRFATQMRAAIDNNNQGALDQSFGNLKSCFKFMGIMMLVIIIFYALMLIFGIGAGIMGAM